MFVFLIDFKFQARWILSRVIPQINLFAVFFSVVNYFIIDFAKYRDVSRRGILGCDAMCWGIHATERCHIPVDEYLNVHHRGKIESRIPIHLFIQNFLACFCFQKRYTWTSRSVVLSCAQLSLSLPCRYAVPLYTILMNILFFPEIDWFFCVVCTKCITWTHNDEAFRVLMLIYLCCLWNYLKDFEQTWYLSSTIEKLFK
jgi:hypothetical protein